MPSCHPSLQQMGSSNLDPYLTYASLGFTSQPPNGSIIQPFLRTPLQKIPVLFNVFVVCERRLVDP